ncbi:hypothetical protein PIN31115_03561 [Pandoraea iniqua]|uniref:Uncharacterized protein n=1 Tax=Pandoraea iniqua TaxID=2508288 RepID=A0A5E4X055_9BURK|nr:zinc chelation protein SecC [Pandoraea iniqua]VVE29672.1 hypothetical protein PIN31115_03561 [Pandoraea iniqua]
MKKKRTDELPDLEALEALMLTYMPDMSLRQIADDCKPFTRDLGAFHPIRLAATFGGLLLQPSLQSNCLRLEALVQLSMALSNGDKSATPAVLMKGFSAVGRSRGRTEDPPEDVFVGNIVSRHGNFLVLEGTWESGTFYLQRFINMVEDLPDDPSLNLMADCVYALLTLSDHACRRAGLVRHQKGSEEQAQVLPKRLAGQHQALRGLVEFSWEDLMQAGVIPNHLEPFTFDIEGRQGLLDQSIGGTDLERSPLAIAGRSFFLVMPTAVSGAIRRFIIEAMGSGGNRDFFVRMLAREYMGELQRSRFLRGPGLRPRFGRAEGGHFSCAAWQVDRGRPVILLCLLDSLEGYEDGGICGLYGPSEALRARLEKAIAEAQDACAKNMALKQGLVLLVTCGVGRGIDYSLDIYERAQWEVVHLAAADFFTLESMQDMPLLELWRILDGNRRLKALGIRLKNANGFLNLAAWGESLDGHLIPHRSIPSEASGQKFIFAIRQNALLDVRHSVARSRDVHAEPFVDGTWRRVHAEGPSYFDDENENPVYGEMEPEGGRKPMGICKGGPRAWWFELASLDGSETGSYERWRMLGTWCRRAAPLLEDAYGLALGEGPVLWKCIFTHPQQFFDPAESFGTAEDAERSITMKVDQVGRTVQLTITPQFDKALFNPSNVAEAALVRALIRGVALLAAQHQIDQEVLFSRIVPNESARQSHVMAAREFRDFIPMLGQQKAINVSKYDDGNTRIGLGWKVRHASEGNVISGKEACRDYLNKLVQKLEDELCEQLRSLDRLDVLCNLLLNYEIASVSRDRWHRTSAANLAFRADDEALALGPMRDHDLKLNTIFQNSRVLIEMALCECPLEGGRRFGEIEHTLLMTLASQIFQLGGWSGLIHWGLMAPQVSIRAVGDVYVDHSFIDSVMTRFGSKASEVRYKGSARRYAKNLELPGITEQVRGVIEPEFLDAWHGEFGSELDAFRQFIDAVENRGIDLQEPVSRLRRSELVALARNAADGEAIVSALSLLTRSSWREVPPGYAERDIESWRLRRRLSVLRRPILQITDEVDPQMLLAPGLLRDALSFVISNYYSASYPDSHLGASMQKYAGFARHRDGHEFNEKVRARMEALGWEALPEVTLTKILASKLERNYGDVDVLAWDALSRRVLVMECKDLQFKKSYSEIAEQLMDYAGELLPNGKRDSLRKHLDRVDLLAAHKEKVVKFLKLGADCSIESHVVFSNPVPMLYAKGDISTRCELHIYDELERLRINPNAPLSRTLSTSGAI